MKAQVHKRRGAGRFLLLLLWAGCCQKGSAVTLDTLVRLLPGGRLPPRRPDPASLHRRRPETLVVYRRALTQFMHWIEAYNLVFETPYEVDDLLVEWRFQEQISKAVFAHAVSAVEIAVPTLKGQLSWSHAIMRDLVLATPSVHHIALPWKVALVIAVCFAAAGFGRLGAGLLLQQSRGLRPNEMLQLRREDILVPEDRPLSGRKSIVLNLGMKAGTKARRAQASILDVEASPVAACCCYALIGSTPPGQLVMFGVNLGLYQRLLAKACQVLGLPPFTPHSARAGFATDLFLSGADFVSIREAGRWLSDASLRVYLDAVTTASVEASHAGQQWAPLADWLGTHFGQVFPWWAETGWTPTLPMPEALAAAAVKLRGRRPALPPSD